ncbi:alkaline shock response membrane anchor protein AmaP [Alicyclobacillus sp.]|uniref:alkaline shock response membrane anchor protein AmaP n=1 Tax=Alicyclobacillus sp. TaxID=61169 RepID=UPI0025C561C0|nr:alkaline shock response membrane anchor protein AmaP [Alicyclobacillus sp.]MCL6516198.1 alkaline shock response membrane anchor protein AmaP [Alicyclobacillus sp.]
MSALDRLLLVVFSLAALAAAAGAFLLGAGALVDAGAPAAWAQYPTGAWLMAGAVVFALLAVRFLFYRLRRREPDFVLLPGDFGHIRISFDTIRELANRTGRSIRGVHELDTRVRHGQSGIVLAVRVRALPDLDLAQMGREIQDAVKAYVERTTAVVVEQVLVSVTEIAGATAAKSARGWSQV